MVSWQKYLDGYYRLVAPRRYHVVRITDMDDAVGRDNAGRPKWATELFEVNLDSVPEGEVISEHDASLVAGSGSADACILESAVGYGAYAPLGDFSGGNRRALAREARRLSRELTDNEDVWVARLNRPVNALGSTALEFARGDFDSALARGLERGDRHAGVMAKIAGKRLAAPAPSDDPLAFMVGYADGKAGEERADPGDDALAPEYVRGYDVGRRVAAGTQEPPPWIRETGDAFQVRQDGGE